MNTDFQGMGGCLIIEWHYGTERSLELHSLQSQLLLSLSHAHDGKNQANKERLHTKPHKKYDPQCQRMGNGGFSPKAFYLAVCSGVASCIRAGWISSRSIDMGCTECLLLCISGSKLADMNTQSHVVVAGGGPSGVAAALAAARCGVPTTVIEYHPVLGGMGTAALVNNFCGGYHDGERFLIGGVYAEIRQLLIDRQAIYITNGGMEPYEPDAYHALLAELCDAAGVKRIHGQRIIQAVEKGSDIVLTLSDQSQVVASALVDATGDAVVAQMASVPVQLGRESDQAVMPVNMCYRFTGLDIDAAEAGWPKTIDPRTGHSRPVYINPDSGERNFFHSGHSSFIDPMLADDRASGLCSIPRDHVAAIHGVPGCPGDATVNFGRVFVNDPTDPHEMAEATQQGECQVHDGIAFFRRRLPGFADIQLQSMARQIGVRQSYQISGLYRLTQDDCLEARQFDDVIAQCNYPVDIHEPGSDKTSFFKLPEGQHYDIPWRCLIPSQGPQRLLVAGRCISADAGAMASFRVQAPALAIGEAAGIGAALAVQGNVSVRDLGHAPVQERLRAVGAVLD
ncbi:MAG: FAD-dependent oxidoreductase [Planctomycetota bacterium]|nr:MAG: FAD-dependent oxidoreductase [Planctomycetota bacterium]